MFEYEHQYLNAGKTFIAGVDEAGRGPLAGPVCCACVIMPLDTDQLIPGINDSKKLTPKKRDALYDQIIQHALAYQIVLIDNQTIDRINILEATKLGMSRAINQLSITPDVVLVDAVRGLDTSIPCIPIIHGDAVSYNIAAASILAKVTRDRLMMQYDQMYPQYQFAQHKGYGTRQHIQALQQYGKCDIHRDSFIKNFIEAKDE